MLVIAVVIVVLAALATILLPARYSAQVGAAAAIAIPALIHSELSVEMSGLVLAAVIAVLLLGCARSRVSLRPPPALLLAFVVYFALVMLLYAEGVLGLLYALGTGFAFVAVATVYASLGADRALQAMLWAAMVIVPIEAAFAVGELLMGQNALWPRRDGFTYRLVGTNNLVGFLGGRAMGTTGYAIPLGIVVAAFSTVLLYAATQYKRRRYWLLLAVAIAVVFASGTRTAVIALALAGAVMLLRSRKKRWGVLLVVLVIGVFVAELAGAITFLSDDVLGSQSFVHRLGIAQSFQAILSRDAIVVIFGGGFADTNSIFAEGLVRTAAGLSLFDNDYLRLFVALGAVGVGLLVGSIGASLLRGPVYAQMGVAVFLVSLASFDVMTWRSLSFLMIAFLAIRAKPIELKQPSDTDSRFGILRSSKYR